MTKARLAQVRAEYLEWLLLDQRTRLVHSLPRTDAEFASLKGTTTRTLRRWKSEEDFQELLEQRRHARASELDPESSVAAAYPQTDARAKRRYERRGPASAKDDPARQHAEPGTPEYEYHEIRTALAARARDGDTQAAQVWMKTFGEPFIEAERSEASSIFADMDDDELVDEALDMIGAERVAEWLAGQAVDESVPV